MPVNKKAAYIGGTFSTNLSSGFRRTDVDLIKIDLLNHLFTRKGERIMMPNFGTNLQDLLFEPLDELLQTRISNEIEQVIVYDPRVELLNMTLTVSEDESSMTVDVLVRFVELDIIDVINLDLPLG